LKQNDSLMCKTVGNSIYYVKLTHNAVTTYQWNVYCTARS